MAKQKLDEKFIREVAKDMGISEELTKADVKRAHKFAKDAADDDYYYRLKEFFTN